MKGSNDIFVRFRDSRWLLPVGALTCAILWGSAFPAIKTAYKFFDAEPLANHIAFAGIRFTVAGIMVLTFVPKLLARIRSCPWPGVLGGAFFQVVLQYTLFYWGLKNTSAVLVAILVSTGSFWWVLLAPFFDKTESLRLRQFLLLVLGFAGVVVCSLSKQGGETAILGPILIALATLSGAFAALLVRPVAKKSSVPFFTGGSLLLGGLVLALIVPFYTIDFLKNMSWQLALLTGWLAFISAAAFSLWFKLVTLYDVPRLSGYRMIIPICGVTESIIFLEGERLTLQLLAGGALVLLSIVLLEGLKRRTAQ